MQTEVEAEAEDSKLKTKHSCWRGIGGFDCPFLFKWSNVHGCVHYVNGINDSCSINTLTIRKMARLSRSFGGFVTRACKDVRTVTHVVAAVAGRGGSSGGSGSSIWLQGIARRTAAVIIGVITSPIAGNTHTPLKMGNRHWKSAV
jgi:hypothetical protein